MNTLNALLLSVLAALVATTPAAADRISVLLGSHHVGPGDYEERNPGLFYTWDDGPVDWTLGAYRNSYGNISVAGYGSVPFAEWDRGEAAVIAGIAHYPERAKNMRYSVGEVVPMVGLSLIQDNLFVQAFPRGFDPLRATIAVGVTFELD